MTLHRRTYRLVDGQRVEGTWRPVFIRNADMYYLTDLVAYADGAIDVDGSLTDLDGLRAKLESGRVVTTIEEGVWASAHHVGMWRMAEPLSDYDPAMLAGEAADEIDRLNDRPDSSGRCRLAVQDYLADPSEENRLLVRERYLEIPEHLRIYSLGDMDLKDRPLRVLITDIGEPLYGSDDGRVVTRKQHDKAIKYFRDSDRAEARWRARIPADGPERPEQPTLTLSRRGYPNGWPDEPDIQVLQNDYAAPIFVGGEQYPTVSHAYWALSTADSQQHDHIAAEPDVYDAAQLAEKAPRRAGWPDARVAVMAALLRAKFTQHPALADVLLSTGDARIMYNDAGSEFWVAAGSRGSNWVGRLLEVIRSELAATRAGIPLD